MIHIKKILITLIAVVAILASCEDVDTVAAVKDSPGILVNIANGSTGEFLGSPENGVDLADAEVVISSAQANLVVNKISGDLNGISKIQLVKFFNGVGTEILVSESTDLPLTAELLDIDALLSGFDITENDLRIGDKIVFKVRVLQNDGDIYYFDEGMGVFSMTLNCSYNLSGTYTMTNSVCGAGSGNAGDVTITQNSDGSWHLDNADGGLLQNCTSNNFPNSGNISVMCGGIVEATNDVTYCDGYGIGCIKGGTWDEDAGILTMTHNDDFFGVGEYTSTYTRQ